MTFLQIYTRFLYLIGESSTSAITAIHKSHINYAVKDITNAFPFSWNLKTATLTLSSGTANLPTDYNPIWHLADARIVGSSSSDDTIFTEIDLKDRDIDSDNSVYWITQSSTIGTYVFNTSTQTGSVVIYYYFIPSDMSGDSDVCAVSDGEAVAYLAAAKNWVGDERNVGLKSEYEKEAASRIQRMYTQDLNFGPQYLQHSPITDNSSINTAGV